MTSASLFPDLDHDPGGKAFPLPAGVIGSAVYGGPDRCYRYLLTWSVGGLPGRTLLAGMMNPSTATEHAADRTLLWVWRWAIRNGFARIVVVNADAYRCTDQGRLAEVDEPCGPENLDHIRFAAEHADTIVVGYGKPKVRAVRDHGARMVEAMRQSGKPIHVWGLSLDGIPKHPLYLPAEAALIEWSAHA